VALTDWWFGYAEGGTVRIVARSDSAGTLSVVTGGQTFTGTTITAAMLDRDDVASTDGIGIVDVTGLTPGGPRQAFSLRLDGVEQFAGTLRPAPATGQQYNVFVMSCIERFNPFNIGNLIDRYDPHLVILLGDTPYCDSGWSGGLGLGTVTGVDSDPTMANWFNTYLQFHRMPALKRLFRSAHMVRIWDDHELADDWDNSWIRLWNACGANGDQTAVFGTAVKPATQANREAAQAVADAYKVKGKRAFKAYAMGNPDEVSSGDTAPCYFAFDYGDARVIVLDCIEHKTHRDMVWLNFTNGGNEPSDLYIEVNGQTSSATAYLVDYNVTSGSWGAGTAAGYLRVNDEDGTFAGTENLREGTTVIAQLSSRQTDPGTLIENSAYARTMLGANQKAWFEGELDTSKTWRLLATSKEWFSVPAGRPDGWRGYTTERGDLNTKWAAYDNVFCVVGDMHYPHAVERQSPDPYCMQINPCPGGTDVETDAGDGYGASNFVRWKLTGYTGDVLDRQVIGVVTMGADQLTARIVDVTGRVLWSGDVAAGANAFSAADVKFG
jgi:hypothetical protein